MGWVSVCDFFKRYFCYGLDQIQVSIVLFDRAKVSVHILLSS